MPFDPAKLVADVEAFCQEVRPLKNSRTPSRTFNDQVIPLGRSTTCSASM